MGKIQPRPLGSGRWFPAVDGMSCPKLLTQGSFQGCAGEREAGPVVLAGRGAAPPGTLPGALGPVAWLGPGEGEDGATGPWLSSLSPGRGPGRGSHLLGPGLKEGNEPWNLPGNSGPPALWRRQAG